MASTTTFGDGNSGFQAGNIYGPASAEIHHHYPPDRPETPPKPSSTVPFRRDADFVDRETLLDQVQQKCATSGSWTALVGLGGVGKSQLAIEYAYQTRDRSPNTWVFWVHASNAARFEQSFRDIVNCVKIPERRDPKANILQLVHDWLRGSKGQWVLILDNVDDAAFLLNAQSDNSGSASKPLREYLPQSQNGFILITTRSNQAALKLVEPCDVITVDPMDEAPALALFEKKLGVQGNTEDIVELAAALEFMPLAIVQAAAYISQRAPRCLVRQYLEEFRRSDRKKTSLLNYEGGQLRRDREAKSSIIITWQISFNYIRQTRPSAGDLLSLMCLFDRQGIPESLLKIRSEQGDAQRNQKERDDEADSDEDSSSQSSQSDEFEDDVMALRNFSFISINADGTTFEMHSLVQLATRKWLEAHGQLERWKQQFIRNLCKEFPTGEYENWTVCQTLFPHAKSAAAQRPEEQDSLRDWASILYKAAWYAEQIGNGVEAEKMSVQAMRVRKKILGVEHKDTLWSMAMVGDAYSLRGRWEEAEKLFIQVMETRKIKLGADHPDTLTSMSNLAETYRNQGRWREAEELQAEELKLCKTKLGGDHPSTLISVNNLALIFWNQGRWEEAEELFVQVMEMNKKKLGADHPSTLTSVNNLASTFYNQGRWDEADELGMQVIEMNKKKLGADHPSTLTSVNNLASTFYNQGRWDKAEELFLQVMETSKMKLGADHPNTLLSMSNLAETYRNQGRWKEAEELGIQVMETRKTKLGADHPDTLASMSNLALTYWNQGRWKEAEELGIQVMETFKTKLGADHPDTLTSMNNLAFTWKEQGRASEATNLMRECARLREQKLGATHPHFISSSSTLAGWEAEQAEARAPAHGDVAEGTGLCIIFGMPCSSQAMIGSVLAGGPLSDRRDLRIAARVQKVTSVLQATVSLQYILLSRWRNYGQSPFVFSGSRCYHTRLGVIHARQKIFHRIPQHCSPLPCHLTLSHAQALPYGAYPRQTFGRFQSMAGLPVNSKSTVSTSWTAAMAELYICSQHFAVIVPQA